MTPRRLVPVIVAVCALVVVGLAAQGAGLQWDEYETRWESGEGEDEQLSVAPSEQITPETGLMKEREGTSVPGWVTWLVLGIVLGVPLALLLIYLARRFLWWLVDAQSVLPERPSEAQILRRDVALVEQAVAAGLAEIDLGADPRSAILACWVHFENASEAVGIEKESSDTPSELVRKLLERHELEGAALERLSESYLRARYSPHQVGEADRDQAREALVEVQRQLGVRETR